MLSIRPIIARIAEKPGKGGEQVMVRKNSKGFTLIELVLVITILGILAVAALPSFINVSTQARQSSMSGVVGAVRSGVGLFRSNDLVSVGPPGRWPGQGGATAMDAAAAGSTAGPANLFFGGVLQQGIADGTWTKGVDANTYIYTIGAGVTCTYTYAPATGTLTGVGAGGAVCP